MFMILAPELQNVQNFGVICFIIIYDIRLSRNELTRTNISIQLGPDTKGQTKESLYSF